jgi:hypothetical protein
MYAEGKKYPEINSPRLKAILKVCICLSIQTGNFSIIFSGKKTFFNIEYYYFSYSADQDKDLSLFTIEIHF